MERRAFLQIAAWLGTAGTLTAPATAAAKAAVKVANQSRLKNFIDLSSFLLGIPLPGIDRLDQTLGALFLSELDKYLGDPDEYAKQTQKKWGTPGFEMPPQPDGLVLSPDTMDKLFQTWQEISVTETDTKILVDRKIFGVADLSTLAQKIIAIWYTGLVNNIPGEASVYSQPYVWEISHAHPGAVPNSFGYWQLDPNKKVTDPSKRSHSNGGQL